MRFGTLAVMMALLVGTGAQAGETHLDTDPYAARKLFYEGHWQRKIERALSFVPGAVVSVDVQLSRHINKATTQEEFGPPTAEVHSSVTSTKSEADASRPATTAEGPGFRVSAKHRPVAEESRSEETVRNIAPKITTAVTHAGLTPESVRVSVVVPRYYSEAVLRKHQTHEGAMTLSKLSEELRLVEKQVQNQIRSILEPLLPELADNRDNYSQVSVTFVEDFRTGRRGVARAASLFEVGDDVFVVINAAESAQNAEHDKPQERYPAEIIEVRTNGALVIRSHTAAVVDGEPATVEVTGVVCSEQVAPDHSVPSYRVANLKINRRVHTADSGLRAGATSTADNKVQQLLQDWDREWPH